METSSVMRSVIRSVHVVTRSGSLGLGVWATSIFRPEAGYGRKGAASRSPIPGLFDARIYMVVIDMRRE
ncbi:hypothetical protein Ate02nite_87290 [Paractinoplanes tereljensis]|uniref:Uncharacterized protein n=1 Tax=Paractinoplanes tereljensis TaxID=571912 RepID=A0A919TYB1_9ACTN|nr:hypothetical protein Ate02nite_87290 [Actinoplanes tereljensis]